MSHLFWSVLALVASFPAWGTADLGPLQGVTGKYPVLDWNGDARVAGSVEIVADDRGVGFILSPLAMSSHPVPSHTILAGKEGTTLVRQNNVVLQDSVLGENRTHIEYRLHPGYIEIVSKTCTPDSAVDPVRCASEEIGVTSGKAAGELVPAASFIQTLQGSYKIDLVGGAKPKEGDDSADVSPDDGQGVLTLPFCPPGTGTCDPGYLFLSYEKTEIYHQILGPGDDLYVILLTQNGKLIHYSWENNQGVITFRNFQYTLKPGVTVTLEHVLHKS